METSSHPLSLFSIAFTFLLCFAALAESRRPSLGRDTAEKAKSATDTWCIAKPSAANLKLRRNIDYSCAQNEVDCRPIQPGGSCYLPATSVSHASFAMNLFYRSAGKKPWNCYFNGTGIIVSENPSVGTCDYPL